MKRFSILFLVLSMVIVHNSYGQSIQDTIELIRRSQDTLRFDPNAKPIFRTDTIKAMSLLAGRMNMASAGQRTADVGKTTLNLDISQGGAAVATLPIILPPGVNGFTPEISLQYNSQSGNGIAGYGWNLGGTSSITRIPATKFHFVQVVKIFIHNRGF